MKKTFLLLAGVIAFVLTACQKSDEVSVLEGGYTYKLSGVVTVQQSDTILSEVHLTPESGTMVASHTANENEILLSFNQNSGDAYDMTAKVGQDSLFLRPIHRTIEVEVAQDTLLLGYVVKHRESFDIEVKGAGHRLTNGDVCLMLSYTGVAANDTTCRLTGENIHVHCKQNAN